MLIRIILFLSLLMSLSQAKDLQKISLQLQWKYQFQFAGFIVAKERGYYEEEGLDVEILEYDNTNIMNSLVDGKIDYAIGNSIVNYENDKLLDVSLLATYLQRSPLVLITQSEIKTVLDLKGKSIEISYHDIHNSSLSTMLTYFSINEKSVTFVKPSFTLESFINHKVDAMTVFRSNELYELDKKNIPYNIVDPIEYGFVTSAINLFASHKKVENSPEEIHHFLEATKRGWEYALEHIDEVSLMIHKKYRPEQSVAALEYEGRATKELMLLNIYDIGEVNEKFVKKTFKQLVKNKKLLATQEAKKLIYNHKHKNKAGDIDFTRKELVWMNNNPVVRYSEINWKPLSIIENGRMSGVMGEYMELIAQRSGLIFEFVSSDSWSDVLEKFTKGEIDVVPGVGSSPQELEMGIVSDAYAQYPIVIVTGKSYNYINTLDEFKGKTLAIPKYYTSYNFVKKNYPEINILATKNINEALLIVQSGKADGFVGHVATSIYYLTQLNLSELKVAGVTSFEFEHRYLADRSNPELISIINRVFQSITPEDRKKINAKWVHTREKEQLDLTVLYWILGVIGIVISLVILRQKVLSNHNKELKVLKERMELALSSSNSGIWDWNKRDNSIYISPQWKEMLGYSDTDLASTFSSWKSRVHPEDIGWVMKKIQDSMREMIEYNEMTYRLVKKDGEVIWILSKASTMYDENSIPYRVIGTHINITQDKAKELKSQQQAQIIDQIHDSVISTDLDGTITSYNYGSFLLLGYTAQEMLNQHITKIYLEEDYEEFGKNIELLKKNEEQHAVTRLVKKSGDVIYADLSLSLLKDENGEVLGMIGYSQDITKRREAEKALLKQKDILNYQAHHDALTGLPNRVFFSQRLEQAIAKSKRQKLKVGLLFIDLDHFKEINDSLGHAVGDEILKEVTTRLSSAIRKEDILARLGGDEFTIIIEGLNESEDVTVLAQKIIEILSEPIKIDDNILYVSSSIGISLYPDDGDNAQDLLKYADAAMYKAKDEGRNNFQFYCTEMTKLAFERVYMEASIREALLNKEFVVFYQAQVDGATDEIIGMEALVRWESPSEGLLSPAKFISIAEATGLIVEIDREVMKIAMTQVSLWKEEGIFPGVLSLNLAIKHLYKNDFLEVLSSTMHECNFSAKDLELEVVEGEIMSNPSEAIKVLNKIRDMGISLAIDDFGTGYSSLSYLKRLPIKKLKIDQSFVKDLPHDEEDIAISRAVIALAKSMNLDIIAEGVETKEQRDFLVSNECRNIQGYYYSKPVNADEMKNILINGFK